MDKIDRLCQWLEDMFICLWNLDSHLICAVSCPLRQSHWHQYCSAASAMSSISSESQD